MKEFKAIVEDIRSQKFTADADDSADISAGVTFSLKTGSDPALSINPTTGVISGTIGNLASDNSAYSVTVTPTSGLNPTYDLNGTATASTTTMTAPRMRSASDDTIPKRRRRSPPTG